MSYTICISPSCPTCEEVLHLLDDMRVLVKVKNLQIEPDCKISIIPALFKGKRLIAYGKDIVSYFKNKKPYNGFGTRKNHSPIKRSR